MSISKQFIEAIEAKFNQQESDKASATEHGIHHQYRLTIEEGKKYDRLVIVSRCVSRREPEPAWPNSRSVHAFVERATGRLIKSAGWSAPAKWGNDLASRYDLSNPDQFSQAVDLADPFGGYLYQ